MYEVFEKLLKQKKLKVVDVSKATKIPQSTFTDWKNGKVKSMKAENIMKIAKFLDVSMEYLMTGKDTHKYVHDYTLINDDYADGINRKLIGLHQKKDHEYTEKLYRFYNKMNLLSDSDRKMIEDLIERMSANGEHED